MSLLGDVGDPVKDAAAIKPVIDAAIVSIITGATTHVVPALRDALTEALDGLTITITISKKVSPT